MKTVLMTGASGFTGHYMVGALQQEGFHVVGLGHGERENGSGADENLACDLTEPAEVNAAVRSANPDFVLHLAALSFVGHGKPQEFYEVNVLGTMNLLDALEQQEKPPEKVIVASSANIYGTPDVGLIGETICPAPVNHYACSKLAMEHMVATRFESLPIIITRPFNYTGPGQHERFLIPKIVNHFAQGRADIELGNLDVSRDFSDVRDVVHAYLRLMTSGLSGDRVNICSGQPVALRSVIDMMSEIAGYEINVRVNPAFVRANEIPVLAGDPHKLESHIGPFERHPFRTTLEDMYRAGQA